jgi:hypothetical protein
MSKKIPFIANKFVSADALKDVTRGSYEHLALRIEDALAESNDQFDSKGVNAVVATFKDEVIVGSSNGKFYRAQYEARDNGIRFFNASPLDIPVLNQSSPEDSARQFALSAVDAILKGQKIEARENIFALAQLNESVEPSDGKDLATIVKGLINSNRLWRAVYREQSESIRNEVADHTKEVISQFESKFTGLYDGTIEEEDFHQYNEDVRNSLALVADRLESIQTKSETAYYTFIESLKGNETAEDQEILEAFSEFAEDYLHDVQDIREHIAFALDNEPCVMCLGQIYDALAESFMDYDVAGLFVENTATRYSGKN